MSRDYVILPDVTFDLSEELRNRYNLDFIRGHIIYPDGSDKHSFLNWDECTYIENCTSEKFYAALKKDPDGFKTSPANIQEYYEAFEKYVKEGKDVLSVSISSGISGSYNFSLKAKEMIEEKYPEAKVECIDSMRYGPGMGLLAVHAAMLKEEGKSLQEVVEYIHENKNRFHQMGWVDDLAFVSKKGRCTQTQAFFGTLIGIKSLGEFDYNGLVTPIAKVKGEKQAFDAMLDYIEATIENPQDQVIFIAETNRKKQAETYKKLIEDRFHPKAVYVNEVYPACGINIGPGLCAAYYVGKPISQGLVEEKALVEKIINK